MTTQVSARNTDIRFLGLPTQIKANAESTNGAYGLLEHWDMPIGFASPYHTHRNEDESFYVLDGQVAFVLGGEWSVVGPGGYVFGPRNIAHGFTVIGDQPARMLLMCNPAGFEDFIVQLAQPIDAAPTPPDMAKLIQTAAAFHIDIHGPLPDMPAGLRTQPTAKQLNHDWITAFKNRDWSAETAIRTRDFVAHLSGAPGPLNFEAWNGFMQAFTTAFPDSKITIEECIAQGTRTATRWSLTGTHQGEFQGIPATGRRIHFQGLEFNRLEGHQFAEHWSMFDNVSLLRQLGALS